MKVVHAAKLSSVPHRFGFCLLQQEVAPAFLKMSYEIIPSTSFCSAKVLCPKSFVANNRAALHRGRADYLQVHLLGADVHLLQFLRFVVEIRSKMVELEFWISPPSEPTERENHETGRAPDFKTSHNMLILTANDG